MILQPLIPKPVFSQIPQVLPDASLIYPYSPHLIPHEFLTLHPVVLTPIKYTSWLT